MGIPRGHSALLVGDEQNGWTYFSKNGGFDNVMQYYDSLQDFYNDPASARYSRDLWLDTTPQQDTDIYNYAKEHYDWPYSGVINNCGDLAGQSLLAGGIPLTPEFPTVPNDQYNQLLQLPISAPFIPPRQH